MSGHNKWSTTKRKKSIIDLKKSRLYSIFNRKIKYSIKNNNNNFDPKSNNALQYVIKNAIKNNIPLNNIKKAINQYKNIISKNKLKNKNIFFIEGYEKEYKVSILLLIKEINFIDSYINIIKKIFKKYNFKFILSKNKLFYFNNYISIKININDISENKILYILIKYQNNGIIDIKFYNGYYEIIILKKLLPIMKMNFIKKNIDLKKIKFDLLYKSNLNFNDININKNILINKLKKKLNNYSFIYKVFVE